MRARWTAVLGVLGFLISGLACSSTSRDSEFADDPAVVLPGGRKMAGQEGEARDLKGVDTQDLVPREKKQWFRLVSQLYAPCQDQPVSIAACIEEGRPCAACAPAAKLLAERVRAGATNSECETAYGLRFGPDIKKVDIGESPSKGPKDAPVTLIAWSDFQCPACKYALPYLEEAVAKFEGRVRLVHKFFPLKFHTRSEPAAKAAFAAKVQGRYWEMEKLLFDNQEALGDADLDRYAKALQLDLKRFHDDMSSEAASKAIERDREEANKAGINGTPHILINGRVFMHGIFRVDTDLESWIALEIELAEQNKRAQKQAQ